MLIPPSLSEQGEVPTAVIFILFYYTFILLYSSSVITLDIENLQNRHVHLADFGSLFSGLVNYAWQKTPRSGYIALTIGYDNQYWRKIYFKTCLEINRHTNLYLFFQNSGLEGKHFSDVWDNYYKMQQAISW